MTRRPIRLRPVLALRWGSPTTRTVHSRIPSARCATPAAKPLLRTAVGVRSDHAGRRCVRGVAVYTRHVKHAICRRTKRPTVRRPSALPSGRRNSWTGGGAVVAGGSSILHCLASSPQVPLGALAAEVSASQRRGVVLVFIRSNVVKMALSGVLKVMRCEHARESVNRARARACEGAPANQREREEYDARSNKI